MMATPPTDLNLYMLNRQRGLLSKVDNYGVEKVPRKAYPSVDLSPWTISTTTTREDELERQREEVVDQVLKHATESGSFNIVNHGVSFEVTDHLENVAQRFFCDLPMEEKYKLGSRDHLNGYVGMFQESFHFVYGGDCNQMDQREFYGAVHCPERRESSKSTPQPATEYSEILQEAMDEFMTQMERLTAILHIILTRALAKAKNQQGALADSFLNEYRSTMSSFCRLSHYPEIPREVPLLHHHVKLDAHSVWGTLAVMHSPPGYGGLQEIHDGKWVKVPSQSKHGGELHVVLGDMLHLISNGLFASNIHRISQDPRAQGRISVTYCAMHVDHDHHQSPLMASPVLDVDHDEEPRFPVFSPSAYSNRFRKQKTQHVALG